jgi:metallo-beta-lactamase class B
MNRLWPSKSIGRAVATVILAVTASALAGDEAHPAADSPAALGHVQAATVLARDDLTAPLFLCRPDAPAVVKHAIETGASKWVVPTRTFDNLYYIGNEFTGVWVLKTSAGLILFDAMASEQNAAQQLVPGLVRLGLDPGAIKVVVVTHGHWDHVGGAAYLQEKFWASVALGGLDWDLIAKTRDTIPGATPRPIPRRDIVVVDGQQITLGDTTVTLYLTPGHTPGTVSALVPAREGGKTFVLVLFGGVNLPPSLEPNDRTGGLREYDESVGRLAELARHAGAVGIMSTQVFAEGGLARLSLSRLRRPGQPNPFVIGAEATARYFALLHECAQASEARVSR